MGRKGDEVELKEMTTSASIATAPGPFIFTTKVSWPFGGVAPMSLEGLRKKSRKKKKKFYGPYIKVANLSM